MNNVLVTAIGSFSADIVIKNLKRAGYTVFGCDIYPKEWIADAYNVKHFYQAPYATESEKYIDFLLKVCAAEKIDYILPLTDVEIDVINSFRECFEKLKIIVCMSSKETINLCRNKQKLTDFINENPDFLNTIHTKKVDELDFEPENYPVICKPYDGRSSQGIRIINSKKEWEYFFHQENTSKYIVQPYIKGSVVTVDVVRSSMFNQVVSIARKELLRTLNGAGTSVYVFSDPALEDKCCELAKLLNITGCVNFEFIIDEKGDYKFIECNPRFSGGVEFSCMVGYDCIRNHMNAFRNSYLDDFLLKHNTYISRKYEEYITSVE